MRADPRRPRASSCGDNRTTRRESKFEKETSSWIQMQNMTLKNSSSYENKDVSVTEMGPASSQGCKKKNEVIQWHKDIPEIILTEANNEEEDSM
ncbi:unnamed protein product [Parnassius apollo]|uniref:(apollo) hypothetical protein n=1 Tax=Parnassius apollo TaxID=110799 RepID=A0A8S3WW13_PARAO|nr:unnamed protein product [Parnassius apollo]